jgi:argininosuccinate lyase
VVASEFQLKITTANLISGYHRDLQTTKKPVFQAVATTRECLSVMALVISQLQVDSENCKNGLTEEVYATEKVYELVKQGIPFREAYGRISKKYE